MAEKQEEQKGTRPFGNNSSGSQPDTQIIDPAPAPQDPMHAEGHPPEAADMPQGVEEKKEQPDAERKEEEKQDLFDRTYVKEDQNYRERHQTHQMHLQLDKRAEDVKSGSALPSNLSRSTTQFKYSQHMLRFLHPYLSCTGDKVVRAPKSAPKAPLES